MVLSAIKILLDFITDLWYVVLLGKEIHNMTTLENFYYGNIAPHEYDVERGSEYDISAKLLIRLPYDEYRGDYPFTAIYA